MPKRQLRPWSDDELRDLIAAGLNAINLYRVVYGPTDKKRPPIEFLVRLARLDYKVGKK